MWCLPVSFKNIISVKNKIGMKKTIGKGGVNEVETEKKTMGKTGIGSMQFFYTESVGI